MPNLLVAHIVSVKEEVAPTVEAAAEEAAAGAAEPEVIKKGKGEEGEGKGRPRKAQGRRQGEQGKKAKESKK